MIAKSFPSYLQSIVPKIMPENGFLAELIVLAFLPSESATIRKASVSTKSLLERLSELRCFPLHPEESTTLSDIFTGSKVVKSPYRSEITDNFFSLERLRESKMLQTPTPAIYDPDKEPVRILFTS
jgi:hypothetical protein